MATDGKIDKYTPKSKRKGGYRSEVKKYTKRKARRLGKENLDDAPTKLPTKGWAN